MYQSQYVKADVKVSQVEQRERLESGITPYSTPTRSEDPVDLSGRNLKRVLDVHYEKPVECRGPLSTTVVVDVWGLTSYP